MTHLLDSNACIRYLNGRSPSIRSRLAATAAGSVVVCSVVKAELFAGAMRSNNPAQTRAKQQAFLVQFDSLPYDLQIAAIAPANNLTLVTHNTREFSRVPGLLLEDWKT